jgi:hypothetical protein
VPLNTTKVVGKAILEAAKAIAREASESTEVIVETTSASKGEVTIESSSESLAETSVDALETEVSAFEAG